MQRDPETKQQLRARIRELEGRLADYERAMREPARRMRPGSITAQSGSTDGDYRSNGRPATDGTDDREFQYRAAIDSANDAIHILDRDYRIVFFSDTFVRWNDRLGLRHDVVGLHLFEAFPFLPEALRDEYESVFETGRVLTTEEWVSVGGLQIFTETRKVPVIRDGRVANIITIIRDATERKLTARRLEGELRLNTLLAELSNALISDSVDIEALSRQVLDAVISLTESTHGYAVAFGVGPDGRPVTAVDKPLASLKVTESGPQLAGSSGPLQGAEGSIGEAFYSNEPVRFSVGRSKKKERAVDNMLCAPATAGGRVRGYIIVTGGCNYTPRDLEATERVATLYALGIERQDARSVLIDHQQHLEELVKNGTAELLAANERLTKEIAERERADHALRASEERYRTLVESAGEAIGTVTADGVFLFVNATGAKRLGGKPADFVGKTMWDVFPLEVANGQMSSVRRVLSTGEGMNVVVPTELQGQIRWYNTTIEPLRDGDGSMNAAMIIARDVHDLHTAREQLERNREEMARTEHLASLGTLSAAISHELTQPLTVVSLALGNALAELEARPDSEIARDNLLDAIAGVDDITSVIDRFRRFAGKATAREVGPVCIEVILKRVMKLLDEQAWRAKLKIETAGFSPSMSINANDKDIEQLFFLLIENAIQAADGDGPNHMRITAGARDGQLEITFVDDCGGIRPSDIGKVFDPFFTTKPAGQGTGLGLCVVESIVSRIGGSIEVSSKFGEGTTFQVCLPVNSQAL